MDLLYEDWKYVKGFEGIYIVSNRGRIISMTRLVLVRKSKNPGFTTRIQKGTVIKKYQFKIGYEKVCLHKNGGDLDISIHRLVALHFVLNPENKPQVNHLDGVRNNNVWYNLEWVTISENHLHAYRFLGRVNPTAKPVIMIDKNGKELARFPNCTEAGKAVNKDFTTISDYIRGKIPWSKEGYSFREAI